MTKVSDYIAQTLAMHGIQDVFLVTGGGAMHLNDAFGRCREIAVHCCHHEQACAIAAESYYRLTNRLAAVNVTSGPGGTNAITGVLGAWQDSLGMIVVSGQVKWETLVRSTGLPLRQYGDQELDIVPLVKHITKYAEMVTDPSTIRYHLEKALYLAKSGRPGPVWLDIPMNVQGAKIDPDTLAGYDPAEDTPTFTTDLKAAVRQLQERLEMAKRPVIMAGTGVRLGRAHDDFLRLVESWGIPVVTAWNAHDLIWDEHPLYAGRPGTIGNRAGNFAVQNADFLLVLGCRLNIRQISYNWENFAREAFKAIVDVDPAELEKPSLKPDLPIHADVADVLRELLAAGPRTPSVEQQTWIEWCRKRKERYPVVQLEYRDQESPINPYVFVEELFDALPENEIVVTGDGTACVVTFQAAHIKRGQRLYTNSGTASMGYDLPAAIGACVASGRPVVCLAGDGSLMMNLQELQTVAGQQLPVKIFILNNQGYHSIRQTQTTYFKDNLVGFDAASGVSFPSFEKLATAFGLPYRRLDHVNDIARVVRETVEGDGPQICEVVLDPTQFFSPKLSSKALPDGRMVSAPLEDMYPFLPREEFLANMLVTPLAE